MTEAERAIRRIAKLIATTVDDPEELPERVLEICIETGWVTEGEVSNWTAGAIEGR